jgi:uncharacterized protein YlxW (UPF0749 family)
LKVSRLHLYITLVCLSAGYLIAFSYTFTQDQEVEGGKTSIQWEKEDQLRARLTEVSKENGQLEQQLRELQQRVTETEVDMSHEQKETSSIHSDLENIRLISGLSKAQGPGINVVLEDSSYASDAQNPNDYIIHEQDVRSVINELYAAGAEAISVNGQRLIHSSSIRCVGPTIIVNGVKSAAPFQVTAIGDSITLSQALQLPGGVMDMLKNWGITIKIETSNEIVVPAYIGEF